MKPILITSFLFLFAISSATAQGNPSSEAEAFFEKAMSAINPRHVTWIKSTANTVNEKDMTDADIKVETTNWAVLGNINNADIEAMCFLVLMQASKSAQEDLKAIMAGVKSINEQKKQQRELLAKMQRQKTIPSVQIDSLKLLRSKTIAIQNKQNPDTVKLVRSVALSKSPTKKELNAMKSQLKNDLDSLSELGEQQQLRMQLIMDRMNKADTAASNAMKKFSDIQNQIIQNLK